MFMLNFKKKAHKSLEVSLSSYDMKELNYFFNPKTWENLEYSKKIEILQELENRFAEEQGREAKHITAKPFLGSTVGAWSKSEDIIMINDFMLSDNSFVFDPLKEGYYRPDASLLLYETVAHEGYHAYQDYVIDNPDKHADKTQLEEWKLNSFSLGNHTNYITSKENFNEYRLQPIERDAFNFGCSKTLGAVKDIENKYGNQYECKCYSEAYKIRSYDNVLNDAKRINPNIIKDMNNKMEINKEQWIEESKGRMSTKNIIGNDLADFNLLSRDNISLYKNPYSLDNGSSEHILIRSLGNTATIVNPSLHEQYLSECEHIYSSWSNKEISSEEYFKQIHELQDELHYYPEYDAERMNSACRDSLLVFPQEELKEIKENNPEDYKNLCRNIACQNGYISFDNENNPGIVSEDFFDEKEQNFSLDQNNYEQESLSQINDEQAYIINDTIEDDMNTISNQTEVSENLERTPEELYIDSEKNKSIYNYEDDKYLKNYNVEEKSIEKSENMDTFAHDDTIPRVDNISENMDSLYEKNTNDHTYDDYNESTEKLSDLIESEQDNNAYESIKVNKNPSELSENNNGPNNDEEKQEYGYF